MEKLTLALEPEAAALFVKHVPIEKKSKGDTGDFFKSFGSGAKYLVCDAGGWYYKMSC